MIDTADDRRFLKMNLFYLADLENTEIFTHLVLSTILILICL